VTAGAWHAEHYNSDSGGRFRHYIVWNEVANGDWFDASPMLDNKHGVSAADTSLWLDMCGPLLPALHAALSECQHDASM
jgi:hypothetical protein